MATETRSEWARRTLDGIVDEEPASCEDRYLRLLELQFLREISDGLEMIQREIGFVPGPPR